VELHAIDANRGEVNMWKEIPSYDSLMLSVVEAMQQLGGTASNREIGECVFENLHLSDDMKDELFYRLVWVRSYLKKFKIVNNHSRGIWSLNNNYLDSNLDEISNIITGDKLPILLHG
jgi:restriction endonuclease Mrr